MKPHEEAYELERAEFLEQKVAEYEDRLGKKLDAHSRSVLRQMIGKEFDHHMREAVRVDNATGHDDQ